jgi:predicted HAD superfamily Cof-like phosphohydrolase
MEKSKFQQVKEFNEEIINLKTVDPAHSLAGKRVDWFLNVVNEEAHEFEEAWKKADTIGMLDALIDMAYFLLGRVYECGFTEAEWDKCFAAVHECNMTKRKGNKGRGSDDDAVKDADWVGPEERIREILNQTVAPDFDPCADIKAATKAMCELEPSPAALEAVEHRKPSVYLENDGCQRILSIDELNLFAKMSPVFKEVTEIAIKKSQDYNNGNGQPASRAAYFPFGLLSYAQMLHTKSQRLNSLAQQDKAPNNESVRDTLLDMINYATFAVEAIDKGEI